MKTKTKLYILGAICYFMLGVFSINAQLIDDNNRLGITLSDGTQVVLYGEAISLSDKKSRNYRYLPFSLRLAKKPDNTPEFLFLKYMTDEKEADGGVNGALLHMLMYWGPTPEQRKELEQILKEGKQGALRGSKLKGAVDIRPDGDTSLRIISATLSDDKLKRSIMQSLNAPVLEGGRVAVASSLSAQGAQLLAATFEKNMAITDLSVELSYKYTVRVPAAKGRVKVHWSKIKEHTDSTYAHYKKNTRKESRGAVGDFFFGKRTVVTSRTYDEVREVIDNLVEEKLIEVDFDESVADERVTKVREAFFDFFLEKMTESTSSEQLSPPSKEEKEAMPNIKYGREYTYNKKYVESKFQEGTETFNLNYRLAMEKPFTITANLASWYDGVKHNKKCVSSVLLNDPFFQHRDINFLLDNESKELFEKGEANYATVTVKKERSSGRDFNDAITIDYEYLKSNGLKTAISYARGDDKNTDDYKYITQWSLTGGNLYPPNPEWQEGSWTDNSITLTPPIVPRTIEFESDLDELKALGIVRATLQLRYLKFDNETETNVPITVSKGVPLIEKTIFTDRDTQGYVYRYILTHKEKGKMVLDWETKINDDYIYATIPQELKDEDPDYLEKIVKAGELLLKPTEDGKVSKAAKILNKFKGVLKVVNGDSE